MYDQLVKFLYCQLIGYHCVYGELHQVKTQTCWTDCVICIVYMM